MILLVVSLCCCCCSRRKKSQQKPKRGKNGEINSKLVIKNFPVVTQDSNFDYSDSSAKSSQQHILNGSGTHSTSSSASSTGYKNELPPNSLFDSSLPKNKYGLTTTSYKIEYGGAQNMATVDSSDSSSSTSLENKTISTSNGGKSSSAHSPFTVLNENGHNSSHGGGHYFSPMASNSYSNFHPKNSSNTLSHTNNKPTVAAPNGLLYNGPTNVYIKTYHQQSSNHPGSDHSQESCYSTPIITHNVNGNKKLVYEVIV